MNFLEYQRLAARTDTHVDDKEPLRLLNAVMGMVGESAETLEHMKKVVFQGHELDPGKLIEEAGDTLWYIAKLARECGVTLEDIAEGNINKLKARYPEGFDSDKSTNRRA